MMRHRSALPICSALLTALSISRAHASECSPPQIHELPSDAARLEVPFNASIWVMREDVDSDFTEQSCRFAPVETGSEVPADLVVHGVGFTDGAGGGCAVSYYRFTEIAELIPQEPLTPGISYEISCGTGGWKHTWLAVEDQPPTYEDLEVVVLEARRTERCDGYLFLDLEFEPIEDEFFASSGLLLVEYPDGRVDVIRGVEQHASRSIAIVDLPLADDEEITLRAINGLGAEVGSWTVDVAGLGGEGGGSCRMEPRGGNDLALVVPLLLLLGGVRPRSRSPALTACS